MTRDELVERTHTTAQADVIIEKALQLGCWPADVVVERDPFELPDRHVLAICGGAKGRPHMLGVSPEGRVYT